MEQKVLEACEIMQDRDEREENKETKKIQAKKRHEEIQKDKENRTSVGGRNN